MHRRIVNATVKTSISNRDNNPTPINTVPRGIDAIHRGLRPEVRCFENRISNVICGKGPGFLFHPFNLSLSNKPRQCIGGSINIEGCKTADVVGDTNVISLMDSIRKGFAGQNPVYRYEIRLVEQGCSSNVFTKHGFDQLRSDFVSRVELQNTFNIELAKLVNRFLLNFTMESCHR